MNSPKLTIIMIAVIASLFIAFSVNAETVTFCFGWDQQLSDNSYGDYLTDNSVDVEARGVYFTVNKKITLLNWQQVYSGNTDSDGCKTFSLDYGETYRVMVVADAYVNGNNRFRAYLPDAGGDDPGDIHAQCVSSILGFVLNTSYQYFTYDYITPYRTSNVMGAATHAFNINSASITNDELSFLTKNVADDGGTYNDDDQLIRLENDARDSKFTIIHEMGHFVQYVTNDHENFLTGCFATGEDAVCLCDGCHNYHSKENQGCSAQEGFADFYSTAVLNDRFGTGCYFRNQACDSYSTYMVDHCQPTPPFIYTYYDGYGVESDWVEFFWELHSGTQYWSLEKITSIFHEVNTSDWDGGGHENVIESMSDAVYSLYGLVSKNYFDDQCDLGDGLSCDDACIGF